MKKYILFILLFGFFSGIQAQIAFRTGSADLDSHLNTVNKDAKQNLPKYKMDLSVEYKVSVKKINSIFALKMEPAEVYLVLRIAKITGRSIDDVLRIYKANKNKGWGYISKQLGIKPGSPEFHALKGKGSKGKGNSGANGHNKGNGNGHGQGKGKGKK